MKTRSKVEFGDFQTPAALARRVCDLLTRLGASPASVIEPTCGTGSFLLASERAFPGCRAIVGYDVNTDHVVAARSVVRRSTVERADFFSNKWRETLRDLEDPILVIGNPPWVTNSAVGALKGTNLPTKSNFQRLSGLDAITGKSNFDISEWMLTSLLECVSGRTAVLAMLCKTVVARKVMHHAWKDNLQISRSAIYGIDALAHFGASVDACLLVCVLEPGARSAECDVFEGLDTMVSTSTFALRGDRLVADLGAFATHGHLSGASSLKWRSGIKHDCSRVMELRREGGADMYVNGLGEFVHLEGDFLYPMLKSSELARGALPSRHMLVTQRSIGEETTGISERAPLTWRYLESHADMLDSRSSSIYRNRPRFSVFGVGDYSFAPWKVAISGFYKHIEFNAVAPKEDRPVVLDDTCYFLPCQSGKEAERLAALLNTDEVKGFFSAFVFWDAKRPITAGLLASLDLDALAVQCGSEWSSGQPSLPLFGSGDVLN